MAKMAKWKLLFVVKFFGWYLSLFWLIIIKLIENVIFKAYNR